MLCRWQQQFCVGDVVWGCCCIHGSTYLDNDRHVGRHVAPHKLIIAELAHIADIDLLRLLSVLRCVAKTGCARVPEADASLCTLGGADSSASGGIELRSIAFCLTLLTARRLVSLLRVSSLRVLCNKPTQLILDRR